MENEGLKQALIDKYGKEKLIIAFCEELFHAIPGENILSIIGMLKTILADEDRRLTIRELGSKYSYGSLLSIISMDEAIRLLNLKKEDKNEK